MSPSALRRCGVDPSYPTKSALCKDHPKRKLTYELAARIFELTTIMKMVLNDFVKLWMPMKTAATCPWLIGFVPSLPGAEAFAEQLVPAS